MPPDNNNYQPPAAPNRSNRKLLIWLLIGFAVIVLLYIGLQILSKLNTGKVIVSTNTKDNKIVVVPYQNSSGNASNQPTKVSAAKTYTSGQTVYLKPGTYFINVTNGTIAAAQTVQVENGQTYRYTINLPDNLPSPEPVGDVNANQFSANAAQLYYVDSHSKNLYRIDSSNKISQVGNVAFGSVQWADTNYAIGQDTSGTLFIINNGNIQPLNNIPAGKNNTPPLFDVAPNHLIYLAVGNNIYVSTANGFKQIYTTDTAPTNLQASNDRVAVLTGEDENGHKPASVVVVGTDGSVMKESNFEDSLVWSADGKYFFTSSEGPSRVFNAKLNAVATAPNFLPPAFAWQNDRIVFYSQNNQLWRYDASNGSAKVVALLDQKQTIVAMHLSDDGAYVYLAVQNVSGSDTYYNLYRYGLKGQSVSAAASQLHEKLPWLVNGCLLSLVNFSSPTVIVLQSQPYDGCIGTAQDFVKQQGSNPAQFNYQLSNIIPSTPSH